MKLPKRVQDRMHAGLKQYQPIVRKLAERDISEADTVTVIKDMLTDIFGYDKYLELTSEQQIRGTFCDLAIQVDKKVHYLCEVKSAGTALNENHLRQAVNYGAHQGIEWVLLTNAIQWRIFRIKFGQPIDWEEVYNFDMGAITRSADDMAKLFMLCRESITTDALEAFHRQAQIFNRFVVSDLLIGDAVIGTLKRDMKRLFDMKVTDEQLRAMLVNEIIKRDALDSDGAKIAQAAVKKASNNAKRRAARSNDS